MRIIKQGNVYKVQQEKRFLWFKPYWDTMQYEDVCNDGLGATDVDYKFETVQEAKDFIDEWRGKPRPFKIIGEYDVEGC